MQTSWAETLELVREAQAGDAEALARLLQRYQPRISRIVALRLGPQLAEFLEVEDLVQETLISAFSSLKGFRPVSVGSFRDWIATIAEHRIRDAERWRRAEKRGGGRPPRRMGNSSGELSSAVFAMDLTTPSQLAAARELEQCLEEALLAMPDQSRSIIDFFYLCGMTHDEIAERLDLGGPSSARSRLSRAMSDLSTRLVRRGADPKLFGKCQGSA